MLERAATPLCHFVTSPPQGGRSGASGGIFYKQSLRRSRTENREFLRIAGGNGFLQSPPLWGRCHAVTEGGILPHTPVSTKARRNARRMRSLMTDAELRLWNELRAHRLMGLSFRRQMPIAGYIVDFACPSHGLIVEIDGSQHAIGDNAIHDQARTQRLEQDGWTVLRFWNDDVLRDIDNVCMHIIRVAGKDHP